MFRKIMRRKSIRPASRRKSNNYFCCHTTKRGGLRKPAKIVKPNRLCYPHIPYDAIRTTGAYNK